MATLATHFFNPFETPCGTPKYSRAGRAGCAERRVRLFDTDTSPALSPVLSALTDNVVALVLARRLFQVAAISKKMEQTDGRR